MKLLFYNTDLSPWIDYVIVADYLKIERQNGIDEIQVVAVVDGLIDKLITAKCCHVIENSKLSMWVLDKSSIKDDRRNVQPLVSFTLYEPLWLLNQRVAERQLFTASGLQAFTSSVVAQNTSGRRSVGTFDLTALDGLSNAFSVTRDVDGESLADMLVEEYKQRNLKLYFIMSVAGGMKLTAGVQYITESRDIILSPLLQNMKVNISSTTNEFGDVYVGGEFRPEDGDPISLRGFFSFGDSGLGLEEHYSRSDKSSEGMTQQSYQAFLDSEAQRIAKKRTINRDISTLTEIVENISTFARWNRAGVVFPVDLSGNISKYMIDEVKTTPNDISFGVSQYQEGVTL